MAYSDFFNDIAGFLDRNKFYFDSIQYTGKTNVSTLIEPRTREANYAHALSFEVFDPFWLLARQWQFGRFKGNDCGSPVTMKIRTINLVYNFLFNKIKIINQKLMILKILYFNII